MATGNMDSDKVTLKPHDAAILTSIFNPSFPYEEEEVQPQPEKEDEPDTPNIKQAKELEIQGVQAAEKGDLDTALTHFNQAIQLAPERASGYNNRAQCLQFKMDTDGALRDLDQAIELSRGQGNVACQAYTQRAIIKRLKDEEALEDFKKAAALGSEFAKQQAIRLNPIAALCNAMMCEMIQNVKEGVLD